MPTEGFPFASFCLGKPLIIKPFKTQLAGIVWVESSVYIPLCSDTEIGDPGKKARGESHDMQVCR